MIGAEGSAYLKEGEWQANLGFRWQRSHRHFVGVVEQRQRRVAKSEVVNNIDLLDFSATYAFTRQFNLSLSVPWIWATRSSLANSKDPTSRAAVGDSGVGDISLMGRWWLWDTAKAFDHNLSLGIGVKFPTGEDGSRDTFKSGAPALRVVDQSIQPGDGGFGYVADFSAFKVIDDGKADRAVACDHAPGAGSASHCHNPDCPLSPTRVQRTETVAYANGSYLFNPRDTNGVPTFRGTPPLTVKDAAFYEQVMSVTDQYLLRAGLTFTNVTKHPDVTFGLGLRMEGVPVNDVFGDSDGFRRPGYAVSIEPSLVWSLGPGETFSLSIPAAVQRNRLQSVADKLATAAGPKYVQGDAAFADYFVLAGYTRRF
ncbi:MAG: hypothetical protein HY303_17080 [Candidatus Wallbacteria bacterium]|nr:hypothetical protein [Candidatus Wallbacteria bacterium]